MKELNNTNVIRRNIGYKIKQFREQKDLTQQAIADELNISLTAYGEIERGHTNFSINRLLEITDILDVSPADLFKKTHQQPKITRNELSAIIQARKEELAGIINESDANRKKIAITVYQIYDIINKTLFAT